MKNVLVIIIIACIMCSAGYGIYKVFFMPEVIPTEDSNDKAEKKDNKRWLTIINDTDEIINEVYVLVGEGTELSHAYRKNPDTKSFSIEISKEYNEYDKFTITLIDRYEMKYEKMIENVDVKGRTEVIISKEDYVKQKGDLKRKIDRFFNRN